MKNSEHNKQEEKAIDFANKLSCYSGGDLPIEELIQYTFDQVIKTLTPEPSKENKISLTILARLTNNALVQIIESETRRAKSVESWLSAITIIEQLRDNTEDLLSDLKNIGFGH